MLADRIIKDGSVDNHRVNICKRPSKAVDMIQARCCRAKCARQLAASARHLSSACFYELPVNGAADGKVNLVGRETHVLQGFVDSACLDKPFLHSRSSCPFQNADDKWQEEMFASMGG